MIVKPMLAATYEQAVDFNKHDYWLSPKLDGVRCLVSRHNALTTKEGGLQIYSEPVLLSRTGKLIPNKAVQKLFSHPDAVGLDGELIVGDPTAEDVFRNTSSKVMTIEGDAEDVRFHAFDIYNLELPYSVRYKHLRNIVEALQQEGLPVMFVESTPVKSKQHFEDLCAFFLERGYEGSMLRRADAPYKYGRSTQKEGYLSKVKLFLDAEAEIVGYEQLVRNTGIVEELIGAIVCEDVGTGVRFSIGSGFTAEQREQLWQSRGEIIGKIVTYKYFPSGGKDLPRFPTFIRFRDDYQA
jgi:DNA ligase 1